MAFTLNTVVPWGRSFQEYQRMFALTDADLQGTILACADGPASFNAEATRQGTHVVSCDPLYRCNRQGLCDRIDATYPEVIKQTRKNHDDFVWKEFASVDALGQARMNAMKTFLDDYDAGRRENRYIDSELPSLAFENQSFDLGLCSHFLFLYTDQLTEDFHIRALLEMARTAREVRIFPIFSLAGIRSQHVDPVTECLRALGFVVTIERVPYEFARGSNEMMRICQSP